MNIKRYDPKLTQYAFDVNVRLGIPEEQTALAIAHSFGKEQEFQEALKDRKKGWIFRRHGEDLASILERICVGSPEYSSTVIEGEYVLMPRTDTYAKGVHALRTPVKQDAITAHPQFTKDDGSLIYRPLTFKETIEARVHDYESNKDTEERKRLFQRWNDSCTAVAYKKGTTKFKIIPTCKELITIGKGFKNGFLPVEYDDIGGIELRSIAGKYNQHLTKDEAVHHPAWLTAVENDAALLKTYSDIVFTERKINGAMAFCVLQNTPQDQLRALFVNSLYSNSNASGDNNLDSNGSFLRGSPVVSAEGTRKR